jgi:hypothetical protein
VNQAICWAYMWILSLFFFLIVLPENQTTGHINTKCQYSFLHNLI